MITDKNFYIYTRRNKFVNYSRLNETGKYVFAFLYYLWEHKNDYFHRINSIKVTSQGRPNGKESSAHYKDKAVDIVISPAEYMPYIMGVMSACMILNLYLGTFTMIEGNKVKNLHIHCDNDFSVRKSTKYYEYTDGRLYGFTYENIESILKIYNFSILEDIQDLGKFKKDTIYYLVTDFPLGRKLKFSDVVNLTAKESLQEYSKEHNWNIYILIILSLTGLYLYSKIKPKRQELIIKNGALL